MSQYTPLHKNEQFESKIIQWRLLCKVIQGVLQFFYSMMMTMQIILETFRGSKTRLRPHNKPQPPRFNSSKIQAVLKNWKSITTKGNHNNNLNAQPPPSFQLPQLGRQTGIELKTLTSSSQRSPPQPYDQLRLHKRRFVRQLRRFRHNVRH